VAGAVADDEGNVIAGLGGVAATTDQGKRQSRAAGCQAIGGS